MQDNAQGEPTSEQIKHLLQEAILRNYPNPERRGCPDQSSLRVAANRRLPHEDPLWQHITHCSPCYQDFLEFRAAVIDQRRARRRIGFAVAAVAAAALIAAIWVSAGYRSAPKVPSDIAHQPPSSLGSGNTLTAVLNMQASPVRGAEGSVPRTSELQRLPRARMSRLLIYLPFGSDPGAYTVELLRDGGGTSPLATFSGSAEIRDGLTVLQVAPDLSQFPPGTYEFSVSRENTAPWTCRFVLGREDETKSAKP